MIRSILSLMFVVAIVVVAVMLTKWLVGKVGDSTRDSVRTRFTKEEVVSLGFGDSGMGMKKGMIDQ